MSAFRIVVVTSPALASGLRLAGATVLVACAEGEATELLRSLAGQPEVGLVVVTDDVWCSVPDRIRGTLQELARPIVLCVPSGDAAGLPSRRALAGEAVEQAIGHRIELTDRLEPAAEAFAGGGE